jgi:hypothetical protein
MHYTVLRRTGKKGGQASGPTLPAVIGGLTRGLGSIFTRWFAGLSITGKLRFLKFLFATNVVSTFFGVVTAKSDEQAAFRAGLGLVGIAADVLAMRQLILARSEAISEYLRLARDAARGGGPNPAQGVGGIRIQQYLGRKIRVSKDPAYDFLDGSTKIQLKGPFIDSETLERAPNIDINAIAEKINASNFNTGFDKLIIDTLGLTDEEAVQLFDLVSTTKPAIWIR